MADSKPTYLTFQHDGELTSLTTTIIEIQPATTLDDNDKQLFKDITDEDVVLITAETIFHPQGGGQPSDVGTIQLATTDNKAENSTTVEIRSARTSVSRAGVVLHLGRYANHTSAPSTLKAGDKVIQKVDPEKRNLFSRYHTAGHVLGSAVRHLLETEVPNFDELKASHFPDSASCEFAGLIAGTHKDAIQKLTDEYVDRDMPVEIDWWDAQDFKNAGLERLTPDAKLLEGTGETKFRVVKIVGAEVYPCGGTHVSSTKLCGKTNVKKISRQKGTSKVSYSVVV